MSLTGAEAITLARTLVDEPDTSALKSSQAVALLNAANLEVYRRIVGVNPDYFAVRSVITFPASTEYVDLSGASYLNANFFKLLSLEASETADGATVSQVPTKLLPMPFTDRILYLRHGGSGRTSVPARYALVGASNLYLAPIVAAPVYLTVYYAPQLTAFTTGTLTSEVLGGRADEYHDAVAYCLANLVNAKGKGSSPLAASLWAEAKAAIDNSGDRSTDEPRRVRYKGRT